MKHVNSKNIRKGHVLELMMEDGFGPDEVLAYAEEYASTITGTRPSRTAIIRIKRIARGLLRDARRGKQQ